MSVAWVGIAAGYYLLNLIVRSPKYRWMAHFTLLLTVLYVLVVGIIQLEPAVRVLSFVVLGSALLGVSLVFTRVQGRRRAASARRRRPAAARPMTDGRRRNGSPPVAADVRMRTAWVNRYASVTSAATGMRRCTV